MMIDSATHTPTGVSIPDSPRGNRMRTPRWFDLRLGLGVILVLGSVAVGARVVAAADDTAPALVASEHLTPGQRLTGDMVQTSDVQLSSSGDMYLSGPVTDGYVVTRAVRAGELVPRTAVVPAGEVGEFQYVTMPLDSAETPSGLRGGDLIDVWLIPAEAQDGTAATPLAEAVSVTEVSRGSGTLGRSSARTVVTVALTGADDPDGDLPALVARILAAARSDQVYVTKRPLVGGS